MTQFEKQPNITKEKFLPNRFGLKKKISDNVLAIIY